MSEIFGASFGIDVSSLQKGLKTANKMIRETESEFKKSAASLGDWNKSEEGLEKRIDSLNKIADIQKAKVEALKKNYDKLVKDGLDPTSDKAIDLRTQINKETEALNKSLSEIQKNEKALENLGKESETANKDLKDLKGSTDKATDGFTIMRGALADLVSYGLQKAIEGFKDLAKFATDAYKAVDDGADAIIKATGATGKEAEALQESYKNVAKNIKGDFSTMGKALGEVSTRFGFTGDELEQATEQFLKFADVTGEDATSAVQYVAKALKASGVDSSKYSKLLDELTAAAQDSGVSISTIANGLEKYGSTMRAMGMDMTDTIALFAQFESAGVNTDTAFAGLKKATQNWTKAGKDAKKELQAVIDEIKNAPSDVAGAQKAMDAFGDKAGTELADAIRTGRFEYASYVNQIANSEGRIEKTYEATQDGFDELDKTIQSVKIDFSEFVNEILTKYGPQIRKAIQKIADTAKKVVDWAIKHLPEIEAAIAGIATAMATLFVAKKIMALVSAFKAYKLATEGATIAQWAMNAAMNANPIGIVVSAITGLVAAIAVLWAKCEWFRDLVKGLWTEIKDTTEKYIGAIVGFFKNAWDLITGTFKEAGAFFAGVWQAIKNVFSGVASWFGTKFLAAWNAIKSVFSAIGDFFGKIWEWVKKPFVAAAEWFGEKFEKVVDAIKKPFAELASFFEEVWKTIQGYYDKITGGVSTVTETASSRLKAKINNSSTKMATGGIVKGATNAIIGEAGAEAVLPLERNTGWMDVLASKINGKGGGVVVNQTNNYVSAHSRYEIYKSQQATARAVKMAIAR